jgi:hypothetical protein
MNLVEDEVIEEFLLVFAAKITPAPVLADEAGVEPVDPRRRDMGGLRCRDIA